VVNTLSAFDLEHIEDLEHTGLLAIPGDALERVVGQSEAVRLAKIAAEQRRHLLLVGPPGTGKSMIAQALALHIHAPTEELRVVHNPENPERPFIEVRDRQMIEAHKRSESERRVVRMKPEELPGTIAIQLGYQCSKCSSFSGAEETTCPDCGEMKSSGIEMTQGGPFGDIFGGLKGVMEATMAQFGGGAKERVQTTRKVGEREEVVVYERDGDTVRMLDQKALERRRKEGRSNPMKVIVPIDRIPFVMSTGASETELLGDVRHDPYGGHPQLGTQPYQRAVAGAIHEAHQGVLFIDELPHLGLTQRFILTAMQDKVFPISGRNPQSAGASVRIDKVPCNFIFVGACNIQDIPEILSPLRSRIIGAGYEVLLDTTMPDTEDNRRKLLQFIAQEISMDGRIPDASGDACMAIIDEARDRARTVDEKTKSLTLRLRELGGLIRTAGDIAAVSQAPLIERVHIVEAKKMARTIEEQIREKYGSYTKGLQHDVSSVQKEKMSPYNMWNKHDSDTPGYE